MSRHAPDPGARGDRGTGCLILVILLAAGVLLGVYLAANPGK